MSHLKMLSYLLLISFVITIIQCAPMTKQEGQEFLKKYGYMSSNKTSDEDFRKSIQEFQETFSLPASGKLDSETTKQMELPRCGHSDRQEIRNNQRIWNKRKLTYKFNNYPISGLSATTARREIQRAFRVWSEHVPLEFEERSRGSSVDIDITFYRNGDGPGKTLAYAYFPRNGDMYFDNEQWTSNSERGFNLFLVAAHEIGHSLGLEHSMNRRALLYPYIPQYNPNFRLHFDDISRIQNLYGNRRSTTNICNANRVNSVFYKNGMVYIIIGNQVWKMNKSKKLQFGYPKQISEEWSGSPSTVDAVYGYKDNIYFHEGKNVWMYDGQMKKTNNDKKLVTNIDDGVTYNHRTYVFKGSQYYRYEDMNKVTGYPRAISSYWTNIPDSIDAVYYEDTYPYKYFYFFKGNKVYKFNMDNKKMMKEMPLREYLSCKI